MLRAPAIAASVLAFGAGAGFVGGWGEPHLEVLPRSAEDAGRVAAVIHPATDFSAPERFETHPGGAATAFGATGAQAFSAPSANLPADRAMDFQLGRGLFEKLWVAAPASTKSSDGLGPLFNARSCLGCHIRNGRGHPPAGPGDAGVSMVLHVSIPKSASDLDAETLAYLANAPEPIYGRQIQDKAVAGIPIEGRLQVTYTPLPVTLGDGTVVELRHPNYEVADPGYGPLHPQAQLSPRVAPPMIGLGLLEAIPEADLLALADPEDSDGDGISGRPNRVWSNEFGQWMLGRFGQKAGSPTVAAQSMSAMSGDMGLSNPTYPAHAGDCSGAQADCMEAPHGGTLSQEGLEAGAQVMELITFYSRNLAVPARRIPDDPQVLRGKEMFYAARCTACHTPKHVTHRLADRPAQSFQLIWPYTDLLLHDMGEGLADGRPEWQATGREWRTAPLWGIGLTETVGGVASYLHDGRARSLLEAILWHGGEAGPAREAVRLMPAEDRNALIEFLESL
ncbi:MAG: di-heme oxidoredictase family protein [Paracoccaceae bacterium]